MIYVASPYTHHNQLTMNRRYSEVIRYTGKLIASGVPCFSPIVYGHQFHILGFAPPHFEFWQELNEQFLSMSDEMHVLMLPGWQESRGVDNELRYATQYHIPVSYIAP